MLFRPSCLFRDFVVFLWFPGAMVILGVELSWFDADCSGPKYFYWDAKYNGWVALRSETAADGEGNCFWAEGGLARKPKS